METAKQEYLEKEEQLLMEVEVWKLQAGTYKAENDRLNSTLLDVRQELAKYKGENVLIKATLKAVL